MDTHLGRLHADIHHLFVVDRGVEADGRVQLSLHGCWLVVVPGKGRKQVVVYRITHSLQVKVFAVVHQLRHAEVVLQRVAWRCQVHQDIGILAVLIVNLRNLTFQLDVLQRVVHHSLQMQWLWQFDRNLQQIPQPVCLVYAGGNDKVVVRVRVHLRNAWQGRQFGSEEVGETLRQRLIVKVARDFHTTEIAFKCHVVNLLRIARLDMQGFQGVVVGG